ncbi:MAG: DUF1566 domain-containing protein [Candidatus Scalindua sp.]|nr:DUF1566 domain-containing protein [Candidatus Scalindua sp.]
MESEGFDRHPEEKKAKSKSIMNTGNRQQKLRSKPVTLTRKEIKTMLAEKGFYDSKLYPRGRGFKNDFGEQKDDKVVMDHASGLMWQRSGSDEGTDYKGAKEYVHQLNQKSFAGHSDWRLPTLEEAMSLMKQTKNRDGLYINSVFDEEQAWIMTSDLHKGLFGTRAWVVDFSSGSCCCISFSSAHCVRTVRALICKNWAPG